MFSCKDANIEAVNPLVELSRVEQAKLRRHAAIASYFRGSLPASLKRDAGTITALYLAAFVHEEQENRRRGAVRLIVGRTRVEPRGRKVGEPMILLESGKQGRTPLDGSDVDGLKVPLPDVPTAESSDPSQVTVDIQARSDGGYDLVSADATGGNTTDPENPVLVTVRCADLTPAVETVGVVSGPVTNVGFGATVIEDRGTPPA